MSFYVFLALPWHLLHGLPGHLQRLPFRAAETPLALGWGKIMSEMQLTKGLQFEILG
jgi:hypothetical protein